VWVGMGQVAMKLMPPIFPGEVCHLDVGAPMWNTLDDCRKGHANWQHTNSFHGHAILVVSVVSIVWGDDWKCGYVWNGKLMWSSAGWIREWRIRK
jgi:hypothetical protein